MNQNYIFNLLVLKHITRQSSMNDSMPTRVEEILRNCRLLLQQCTKTGKTGPNDIRTIFKKFCHSVPRISSSEPYLIGFEDEMLLSAMAEAAAHSATRRRRLWRQLPKSPGAAARVAPTHYKQAYQKLIQKFKVVL